MEILVENSLARTLAWLEVDEPEVAAARDDSRRRVRGSSTPTAVPTALRCVLLRHLQRGLLAQRRR